MYFIIHSCGISQASIVPLALCKVLGGMKCRFQLNLSVVQDKSDT